MGQYLLLLQKQSYDKKVLSAATSAVAHHFIMGLPKEYKTYIQSLKFFIISKKFSASKTTKGLCLFFLITTIGS